MSDNELRKLKIIDVDIYIIFILIFSSSGAIIWFLLFEASFILIFVIISIIILVIDVVLVIVPTYLQLTQVIRLQNLRHEVLINLQTIITETELSEIQNMSHMLNFSANFLRRFIFNYSRNRVIYLSALAIYGIITTINQIWN